MQKITIVHQNNIIEEIIAIHSGITAIGYQIDISETKRILIHPAMVKWIRIEEIKEERK